MKTSVQDCQRICEDNCILATVTRSVIRRHNLKDHNIEFLHLLFRSVYGLISLCSDYGRYIYSGQYWSGLSILCQRPRQVVEGYTFLQVGSCKWYDMLCVQALDIRTTEGREGGGDNHFVSDGLQRAKKPQNVRIIRWFEGRATSVCIKREPCNPRPFAAWNRCSLTAAGFDKQGCTLQYKQGWTAELRYLAASRLHIKTR